MTLAYSRGSKTITSPFLADEHALKQDKRLLHFTVVDVHQLTFQRERNRYKQLIRDVSIFNPKSWSRRWWGRWLHAAPCQVRTYASTHYHYKLFIEALIEEQSSTVLDSDSLHILVTTKPAKVVVKKDTPEHHVYIHVHSTQDKIPPISVWIPIFDSQ